MWGEVTQKKMFKEGYMKKIVMIIAAALVLTGSVFGLETGDDSPSFANMDLSEKFILSKNYIGKSWIIIDFFATYCAPCKEEIPKLEGLVKEFRSQGLQCFVMATDKDGKKVVEPYFKDISANFTVLIDRFMVTAKRFGVDSIPTVFLINPEGKIAFKSIGYSKQAIDEMRIILTSALSG